MNEIFFSYASEDRARVEKIVHVLEGRGLDVWWDRDLVAGAMYERVIEQHLDDAPVVMVAWSEHSVASRWVRAEAGRGLERGVLVPVRLDGSRLPMPFGELHTPDLSHWNGGQHDDEFATLVDQIRTRLGPADGLVPPDHQDRSARPRPSRRTLLLGGLGGLVLVGGAGWWGYERLWPSLPTPHVEQFAVASFDEDGTRLPDQLRNVQAFALGVPGGAAIEFSLLPGGPAIIGSPASEAGRQPNEGPQEAMTVPSFAMSRTAVTQRQWAAVVAAVPNRSGRPWLSGSPSSFAGDDLPVETITWTDATEFCARASEVTGFRVRLPSEAEWEYACRAGTPTAFNVGPTISTDVANYCGTGGAVRGTDHGRDLTSDTYGTEQYSSGGYGPGPTGIFRNTTVPVRTFPPNRFGLYEMHGNVWEYCADTGPVDYRRIPTDGSPYLGGEASHALRGGSWSHNPAICRSAYRDGLGTDSSGWDGRVGFRVVCEP